MPGATPGRRQDSVGQGRRACVRAGRARARCRTARRRARARARASSVRPRRVSSSPRTLGSRCEPASCPRPTRSSTMGSAAAGPWRHRDGDRAVQLDDRRGRQPAERLVEHHDPLPVGLVDGRRDRVALGDRGLHAVRTEPATDPPGPGEGGPPAADRRPVPARRSCSLEQHRLAVVAQAGGEPGRGELQQGEQPVRLGLVGHQPRQHPGQPHRLVGQVGPDPVVAGAWPSSPR